jgi:hypothetical protein
MDISSYVQFLDPSKEEHDAIAWQTPALLLYQGVWREDPSLPGIEAHAHSRPLSLNDATLLRKVVGAGDRRPSSF